MQNYTFRLKPGQDLFDSIEAFIKDRAGIVNAGTGIQENSFWHVSFCERSVARHLCRSTIANMTHPKLKDSATDTCTAPNARFA